MNPTSIVMPATKTYEERLLVYTPTTDKIGVLQLIDKRKVNSKKAKVRRYLVQPERNDQIGQLTFRLTKPKGKDQETYFVCVNLPNFKSTDECTCRGYESDGHCSHTAAIRTLYEKGLLGGAANPKPQTAAAVTPPAV